MDPFSISLGVVQLTGVALKVSLVIYKKLKVFRNYSREVARVLKAVDRQRKNFVHEIHLLLRQALGCENEDDIEQMLEDIEHPIWKSRELQTGLEAAFGRDVLDTLEGTIEDIGAILRTLQEGLCCFDEIVGMCAKNEPLKDTVRRLRKKVKITWDKSKFEEQIKELRELNDDLGRLRKQAAEIKEPPICSIPSTRPTQQLSKEYGSIGKVRRASKAFHQALASAWLRAMASAPSEEGRHNVKLLLDTEVDEEVQMEVVIACYGHCRPQPPGLVQTVPTRLHVESRILDFIDSGLNTPPESDDDHRKRRRVQFTGDGTQELAVTPVFTAVFEDTVDLRSVQDICTILHSRDPSYRASKCLGYLDSCANETFRHSFFQSPVIPTSGSMSESSIVSTKEILSNPAETSVTFVDQLKLARSFAMAVLKFHSTPWLKEYFSLQDLCFFRLGNSDLSTWVQTAHLGLDFVPIPTEDMDDGGNDALENAKLAYGVRNLTLWGLGTVLLQIGRWSVIESPDDVVQVRRLAQRVPMLGRRYRDLTKQCLDCDFAYGDDLAKPRLQQAVYEHVVCGLADMISSLDIGDE